MMRGRDRELKVVFDMIGAAETGRGGILLVEGEPGIGKSYLLRESLEAAAGRGFSVHTHDAYELPVCMSVGTRTHRRPMQVTIDGNGAYEDSDGQIASFQAGGPDRPERGKELIVIDDLQCADLATLWRLGDLPPRIRIRGGLWILARSTVSACSHAERLFYDLERAGAVRMPLRPLDRAATAGLLADELGTSPGQDLLDLAAGAGGNPLLLVELAAGLRDEGLIGRGTRLPSMSSGRLPRRLRAAVRRWIGDLGSRVRQILQVGAVLGDSFEVDTVAALLGETPAELLPELEAALAAGALVTIRGSLAFRGELVRRAVVEDVPVSARRALHRQAGEFLLEHGAEPAEATAHLISASRPCEPQALARLDQAIRETQAAAPQAAADLAASAVSLSSPSDPERISRVLTAVEALTVAMRLSEAEEMARGALSQPMPATASNRLRGLLASVLLYSGRPAAAAAEAARVLDESGRSDGSSEEAELALLLGLYATAKDTCVAQAQASAILGTPDRRNRTAVMGAFLLKGMTAWREGRFLEALGHAREAVTEVDADPVLVHRALPMLTLAHMLISLGCQDEATKVIGALGKNAEDIQLDGCIAIADILQAYLALAAGDASEASARAQSGLQLAETRGSHLLSLLGLSIMATAAFRSGALREAAGYVEKFQACVSMDGTGFGAARCLLVAAEVAEAHVGPQGAAPLVGTIFERLADDRGVLVAEPAAPAWLVRFALSQQDREHAHAASAAANALTVSNPGLSSVEAAAAHARGLLEGDPDALSRAAARSPDPWARASAAEDLGKLLAEQGSVREAGQRLEEALAGYLGTDARRDARRVQRRLRGLGIRVQRSVHAKRPRTGWASLTDTECVVSDLVAQGLTNRQIARELYMSAHTVAYHLRQIYLKLDIHSRVDLARIVTDHGRQAETGRAS
jgi:DNA-binding CsgD family transcriptional regulator